MFFNKNTIGSKLCALAILPALFLTSCAPPPYTPKTMKITDSSLTCMEIVNEIAVAKQHKKEARSQDTFQFKYMLIVPAVVGMYQWDKAEKASQKRIDYLQDLYNQRNCRAELILEQKGTPPQQPQPISPYSQQPHNSAPIYAPYPQNYYNPSSHEIQKNDAMTEHIAQNTTVTPPDLSMNDHNINQPFPYVNNHSPSAQPEQMPSISQNSQNFSDLNTSHMNMDMAMMGPIPAPIEENLDEVIYDGVTPPVQAFSPKRPDENGQSDFTPPPLSVLHNDPNFVLIPTSK